MAPQYPAWLQWYKKPSYVDIKEYASRIKEEDVFSKAHPPRERAQSVSTGPSRLSLGRILNNQTCSPMSLHDFYMYLKHIEYSAENLEFYIWFKDYQSRYAQSSESISGAQASPVDEMDSKSGSDDSILNGLNKIQEGAPATAPFNQDIDPEKYTDTVLNIEALLSLDTLCSKNIRADNILSKLAKSVATKWSHSNSVGSEQHALSLTALESSREAELVAITAIFLTPDSEKELNIPSGMRKAVLENIAHSTSPHHLEEVAKHCYMLLDECSHGNFLRLGVSNGTFETICMATTSGIILTLGAFLSVFLLAFLEPRKHSRWEVVCIWPMWCLGAGFILSSLRGSCFFFLLFSRRQPLPWERIEDDSSIKAPRSAFMKVLMKVNLFDQKLKIKDSGLRKLQRRIVFQSLLGGSVIATLLVIMFASLPIWK